MDPMFPAQETDTGSVRWCPGRGIAHLELKNQSGVNRSVAIGEQWNRKVTMD